MSDDLADHRSSRAPPPLPGGRRPSPPVQNTSQWPRTVKTTRRLPEPVDTTRCWNMTTRSDTSVDLNARYAIWAEDRLPTDLPARLGRFRTFTSAALDQLSALTEEVEQRLDHAAPAHAIDRFLAAGADFDDRVNRRATIRVLERLTGLRLPALPWPGWTHPDPNARRRVMTGIEIGLVRWCSLETAQRAAVAGALDAGSTSAELVDITTDIVTVDDHGQAMGLVLPGSGRSNPSGFPGASGREAELLDWCRPAFTEQLGKVSAGASLLYGGHSESRAGIQSAILMHLSKAVFRDAGVDGDPTVKPISIRNTAARAVYEQSGIEAAAAFLGHDDLMFVMREIGCRPHLPAGR